MAAYGRTQSTGSVLIYRARTQGGTAQYSEKEEMQLRLVLHGAVRFCMLAARFVWIVGFEVTSMAIPTKGDICPPRSSP